MYARLLSHNLTAESTNFRVLFRQQTSTANLSRGCLAHISWGSREPAMSNKFIDTIKHAIIEDDDPKSDGKSAPHSDAATTVPAAAPVAAPIPSPYHPSSQAMSEEADHLYQRILAKTNFESTAVAATIHKYLDPLAAIASLDERTRFKTAVIQAKAQEGLT